MNIIFLDFDGVINTPIYSEERKVIDYNCPSDQRVNNRTAVEYVNMLGKLWNAKIVVSSSWRDRGINHVKEILKNSGLDIEVIGITPWLQQKRGLEIQTWLNKHPEVTNFVILDDDDDMDHLSNRLIKCRSSYGFMEDEYQRAKIMFIE